MNEASQPLASDVSWQKIQWPARERVDATARAALPREAAEKVDASDVPVLVPARALERVTLVVEPGYFAFSGWDGELRVYVEGHAQVKNVDVGKAPAPTDQVRGVPAWVSENEGIRYVSFFENGASYVVDVECARVAEDARCADDKTVRALTESLAFVGGKGQGGGR